MELKTINGKDLIPSEWNPRSEFDEEKLQLLRESIKGIGLVEPLVVRPYPNRKGKYLITAGERRWRSSPDNGFLCLVRDESDLDAKVACLVENYVRENIADEDHEKFISNIFKEGLKDKKWDSEKQMAKKTGIPFSVVTLNIRAFEDRKSLSLNEPTITTSDIIESKSLSEKPKVRKILLERRAKDEIKGHHAVHSWAVELNKLPEDKALEIVRIAKDLDDVKIAVEIHKGIRKPMFSLEDDRLSKFERVKIRCEGIINITPSFIDAIKNIKDRKIAVDLLKATYEHLHKLLIALDEIEVVELNDKTMESRNKTSI